MPAHWGYVIFTVVNFLATTIGMVLVDRKGRKFLLVMGTGGMIVGNGQCGLAVSSTTEKFGVDCRDAVQAMVGPDQELTLRFDPAEASQLLGGAMQRDRQRHRQPPRIAGDHLLLRRLHCRHKLCALRRRCGRAH